MVITHVQNLFFLCLPYMLSFFVLSGFHYFLSLALCVFTLDPYCCVPLFIQNESKCVHTLGRLLGPDRLATRCFNYHIVSLYPKIFLQHRFFYFLSYSLDLFTKDPPGRTEEELSCNSLTTLSCHLLCFPFALDLPPLTMSSVLQVYDSCGIHSSLLQVWAFSSSYQHLSLWCNRA